MRYFNEKDTKLIDNTYKQIGLNVKRLRKKHNLTQLELSHAMGHKSVSIISCAEICHNNYHFNIEHLLRIAYVLDEPISEFFKDVDELKKKKK